MSFLDELGNILPGQQGGGWQAWLADPVNKAGLLSFGAQALTGTGGNFAGEMGAAISKGFEGAAATDKAVRAQQEADEDQALKASEGAANRSNQMEVAKLGAASREALARERQAGALQMLGIRNDAAMDRALVRQGGGAGGAGKPMNWNQSVTKAQEDDKAENPMRINNLTPEEADAREARIHSKALRYFQMGREEGAAPGAAAPAAPAAKGAPAAGAPAAAPAAGGGLSLQKLQQNPVILEALKTPQGRAELGARPQFKAAVDEYKRLNKIED